MMFWFFVFLFAGSRGITYFMVGKIMPRCMHFAWPRGVPFRLEKCGNSYYHLKSLYISCNFKKNFNVIILVSAQYKLKSNKNLCLYFFNRNQNTQKKKIHLDHLIVFLIWIQSSIQIYFKKHWYLIIIQLYIYIYWIRGNLTFWKAHFMSSGEWVKSRLSQALIKNTHPDSNSKPIM